VVTTAGKKSSFLPPKLGFKVLKVLSNLQMPDTNYDHNQRFGHANARNSNLYLNIICVKLVTQVKKKN